MSKGILFLYNGNMEFIKIGEIINTFGIKGELKVRSFSDFEEERYRKDSFVYVGEEHLKLSVKSFRHHKGFTLLLFNDYEDINLVEKFRNKMIYKSTDDIPPLENGQYYFRDLIGLDVYVNNEKAGTCIDMEEGVRNNYLRVKTEKKMVLVPYLPAFIESVSLDEKRINVKAMEGLL